MGFRIENGRVQGGSYMVENQEVIERGLRVWLAEEKLEKVHYELYNPAAEQAYERCDVELDYLTDPKAEVTKPPIAQLEELFTKLEKLPADARFRLLVTVGPDASQVPGWGPSRLHDFAGGVKEEHKVGGAGHGYGAIVGHPTYYVSNWNRDGQKPA